jgi:hypothetical protein
MDFLLESPQFSPQRAHVGSIRELNGASNPLQGTLNFEDLSEASLKQLFSTPCETDPYRILPNQPGAKLDSGKIDVLRGTIRYFPKALEAVARVSELGARKYAWDGWRTVPDGINRYGAALARHLVYEPYARDSGAGGLGEDVLHASEVAWNALARLELILKEIDEPSSHSND